MVGEPHRFTVTPLELIAFQAAIWASRRASWRSFCRDLRRHFASVNRARVNDRSGQGFTR
jgi:hypothetical protein